MAQAKTPTDLPKHAWWAALKRTFKEFMDDDLPDWAAALTYYSVLSIFPAVVVLASVVGLVGESATRPLIDNLQQLAPGQAREFIRASNAIYEVAEGRPVWKTIPLRVALTLAMVILLTVSALGVVVTGTIADRVGGLFGLGSTAVTVWDIAKWPVLAALVSLAIALLYWASPNVRHPGFRWLTPGSVLAVLTWVVASVGFAVYVANFGSYNKVYGSLASVVVFLIWLWISNLAVLFGAEFDAELARGKQMAQGQPESAEPILEPRDTRAME
ncbi:MAG: YihY/virulence factor BrkB family protein [Pseudonocardiaceae bacterium]|nr:YihY/virulence factor BrkB family protein [Pseudonocardiaceae bacterium]